MLSIVENSALATLIAERDALAAVAEQRLKWLSDACLAAGPDCCDTPGVCEPQYLAEAVKKLRRDAERWRMFCKRNADYVGYWEPKLTSWPREVATGG
jgi:hypothetical protein